MLKIKVNLFFTVLSYNTQFYINTLIALLRYCSNYIFYFHIIDYKPGKYGISFKLNV